MACSATAAPSAAAQFAFVMAALCLCFAVFLQIRIPVVSRVRRQAMAVCAVRAQRAVDGRVFEHVVEGLTAIQTAWAPYERGPSFERCLWTITKWRFRDFYPDLARP